MEQPRNGSSSARALGLVATNVTKLIGAVIALNEWLVRSEPRAGSIAIVAVMVAGAQAAETFIDKLFGK